MAAAYSLKKQGAFMSDGQDLSVKTNMDTVIPASEREHLRALAKKQLEYAKLPVMAERERLWRLHNSLGGERPMVVMEEDTFLEEIMPPPRCESPLGKKIEQTICHAIAAYETFDDDKVAPDYFPVYFDISVNFLGLAIRKTLAAEGVGFHIEPAFKTLEEGLPLLRHSDFMYDKAATDLLEKAACDILGDILPIAHKNSFHWWDTMHTWQVVHLMGMENMYLAMALESDKFHRLMRIVTDELLACLRWQEENGLLLLNNGNDYLGAGSFCFTDELPGLGFNGKARICDTWGHLNSQESIGISPEMFAEFIYPYCAETAAEYGLVYYGCCEPVHKIWDLCLSNLPNLRKVSISAWCDEEIMSERLKNGKVIYSRKPSPLFLGVTAAFDEEAFTAYIGKTASLLRGGCKAEFIFRDIYKLNGNLEKLRRAVEITRRMAENIY
jgi:hypothetical protein